ncbi:SMI1/KNR4 family protein [Lysinibacillus sp. MHQ-1]|nr:SMI1/KNR4 family protein [Lysinibacillus sp. MHQ-1]
MSPLDNIVTGNPPASEHDILLIEQTMAIHLPQEYKNVLKEANGFALTNGVLIYGTEEIMERNETWEVSEYAKGYVAIGDDGGGMVFFNGVRERSLSGFCCGCWRYEPAACYIGLFPIKQVATRRLIRIEKV